MTEETKKRKTHTSAAVKNRYAAKTYDRITLIVKKGQKEIIKQRADDKGMSLNEYVTSLIKADIPSLSEPLI